MKRVKMLVLSLTVLPMMTFAGCELTQDVFNGVLDFIKGLGNA